MLAMLRPIWSVHVRLRVREWINFTLVSLSCLVLCVAVALDAVQGTVPIATASVVILVLAKGRLVG